MIDIILIALLAQLPAFGDSHVKKVNVAVDELSQVHTAVGIATIIQCPEAISSVIIGDQGAFKIEYLDRAITIKPLRGGAKTNLYISTINTRYSVRLTSVAQDSADFIVYLAPKSNIDKADVKWREFQRSVTKGNLTLELKRVGHAQGFIVLDMELKSLVGQKIDPSLVYLSQGSESKVINSLFISSTEVSVKSPMTVMISLSQNDLVKGVPATLEVKPSKRSQVSMELSREVLWRR